MFLCQYRRTNSERKCKAQVITKTNQNKRSLVLAKMSYFSNFTGETGKLILGDIIKTCNQPENSKKLSEAKAAAGKEMIQMMHLVFPHVMQIQIDIIKNYGFPANREGLIQFEQLIRELEKDDLEIARLRSQIRAIYLPPITINPANDILIWACSADDLNWYAGNRLYYEMCNHNYIFM